MKVKVTSRTKGAVHYSVPGIGTMRQVITPWKPLTLPDEFEVDERGVPLRSAWVRRDGRKDKPLKEQYVER